MTSRPGLADAKQSAWFDSGGAPRLRDSFVLFMDLLGTRGVRAGAESLDHLLLVRDAVSRARAACLPADGEDSVAMRWFSDNLAIACPVGDAHATSRLLQLLVEASYLQVAFVTAGLVGRGAIARGAFFADGAFIYGPALERAVVLEHSRAIHPRCVLDEASIAVANHGLTVEHRRGSGSPWRAQLAADSSGAVFVDYLAVAHDDPASYGIEIDELLERHGAVIEENLHRFDGIPSIDAKYRWLAGYHNFVVEQLGGDQVVKDRRRLPVSRSDHGFRRFAPL